MSDSYKAYITKYQIFFSILKGICLRSCPFYQRITVHEHAGPHVISQIYSSNICQVWCKFYNSVCQCSFKSITQTMIFLRAKEELASRGHKTSKAELVEWCLKIEWRFHILTMHNLYKLESWWKKHFFKSFFTIWSH